MIPLTQRKNANSDKTNTPMKATITAVAAVKNLSSEIAKTKGMGSIHANNGVKPFKSYAVLGSNISENCSNAIIDTPTGIDAANNKKNRPQDTTEDLVVKISVKIVKDAANPAEININSVIRNSVE